MCAGSPCRNWIAALHTPATQRNIGSALRVVDFMSNCWLELQPKGKLNHTRILVLGQDFPKV